MLTREEAISFRKELDSYNFNSRSIDHIFDAIIEKFTEKPKRKIQVGDIYRDKEGKIREIDEILLDSESIFVKGVASSYDLNGLARDREPNWDLDLSTCYQLVEVEDE
jgi:hypothetical protein